MFSSVVIDKCSLVHLPETGHKLCRFSESATKGFPPTIDLSRSNRAVLLERKQTIVDQAKGMSRAGTRNPDT